MRKIVKGDEVIVLTGKYRNKLGVVLRICSGGEKIVVEGINLLKKCEKPNPQKNKVGGIVEQEGSIHISNVALYDPIAKKATRVGFKNLKDGKKVRYYKKSKEVVEMN